MQNGQEATLSAVSPAITQVEGLPTRYISGPASGGCRTPKPRLHTAMTEVKEVAREWSYVPSRKGTACRKVPVPQVRTA